MKEYAPLALLVLVMLGSLYSLDFAYNYSYDSIFKTNTITGAAVSEASSVECVYKEITDGSGYRNGYECSLEPGKLYKNVDRCYDNPESPCNSNFAGNTIAPQTTAAMPVFITPRLTEDKSFRVNVRLSPNSQNCYMSVLDSKRDYGYKFEDACELDEEDTDVCHQGVVEQRILSQKRQVSCTENLELQVNVPDDCGKDDETISCTVYVFANSQRASQVFTINYNEEQGSEESTVSGPSGTSEEKCAFKQEGSGVNYKSGYACKFESGKFYKNWDRCNDSPTCNPESGKPQIGEEGNEKGEVVSDEELLGKEVEGADLVVGIAAPSEMLTGNTYQVKVKVANRGSKSTTASTRQPMAFGSFITILYLTPGSSTIGTYQEIQQLGSREIKTLTFNWPVPETLEGAYNLLARADTQDRIDEGTYENNNEGTKAVAITKSLAGNLVVSGIERVSRNDDVLDVKVTIRNAGGLHVKRNPNVGGTVFLPVKVKVTGPVSCEGSNYLYDPENILPTKEEAVTVSLKKPDNSQCLLTKGNYVIEARIDNSLGYAVENAADNFKSVSLPFKTQAEIQCSGKDTGFRPEGVGKFCDRDGVLRPQLPDGIACSNSFECRSNLCFGGICTASCEVASGGKKVHVPVGVINSGLYCDADGVVKQKNQIGSCSEYYECVTNVCKLGKCVSESALNRALCELNILPNC